MDKEKKVRSAEEWEVLATNALDEIHKHCLLCADDSEENIFKMGYHAAYMKFSQLTPSSREEEQWISVEERLPEDIDVVLVWSTTSIKPTVAYYFQNDWLYHSINNGQFWLKEELHIKITHWMPLPSPPKKTNP
jgi:hypothetical protein